MVTIELSESKCIQDWAEVCGEVIAELMRKKGLQEGPLIYMELEKRLNGDCPAESERMDTEKE